jgi:hypothetical protein
MTPTEIEKKAEDTAVACLTAIRRARATGGGSDRDIREIMVNIFGAVLADIVLGRPQR